MVKEFWDSGQFGEPPWNRYVAVQTISPNDLLFEFGVREMAADGLDIAIATEPQLDQAKGVYEWMGLPGWFQQKAKEDVLKQRLPPLSTLEWLDVPYWRRQSSSVTLSVTMSLFVYVHVDEPIANWDCWWRSVKDSSGYGCRTEVDVIDIPPGVVDARSLIKSSHSQR